MRIHIGPANISQGVFKDRESAQLEPGQSPNSVNFVHRNGKLSLRPGSKLFDTILTDISSTNGRDAAWTGIHRLQFEDGTDKLYVLNANGVWNWGAGGFALISSSGSVSAGTDLTPWETSFGIDADGFGGTGTFFACNGQNQVIYVNESNSSFVHSLTSPAGAFSYSGGPATMAARYCLVYGGHLILGYTTEGVTSHVARTRASAVNNFLEFDTTNGAQVVDHLDNSSGEITGLKQLGGQLYVLKEDAIIRGYQTDDPNSPLVYPVQYSEGCLEGRSWRELTPGVAMFLGRENFFIIRGGGEPQAVGDPIANDLLRRINYARRRQICAHVHQGVGVYRCYVPEGSDDYAKLAYCYNFLENKWWVEEYERAVTATGRVNFGAGTLISALTKTLASYTSVISEWGPQDQAVDQLIGMDYGDSTYAIMKLEAITYDQGSSNTDLTGVWESGDFQLNPEGGYSTLYLVVVHYTSTLDFYLTTSISSDRGDTYEIDNTKLLEKGTNKRAAFGFRRTALYHRIKLEVNPSPFEAGEGTIDLQTLALQHVPRRMQR